MADSGQGNSWRRYEVQHEPESPRGGPFANLLLFFFCGVVGAGLGFILVLALVMRAMPRTGDPDAQEALANLMIRAPLAGAAVGAILSIGFVARSLRAKAQADRRD